MPNIRSQIVGPLDSLGGSFVGKVGIHITASDGRSITITKEDILATPELQNGNGKIKVKKAKEWSAKQLSSRLGEAQVPEDKIVVEFGDDGTPSPLEVLS